MRGAADEAGVPEPVPAPEALPSGEEVLVAGSVVPVEPDGIVVATITPSPRSVETKAPPQRISTSTMRERAPLASTTSLSTSTIKMNYCSLSKNGIGY